MPPTEPPTLLKWSADIILVRHHADGSSGPELDGEATLVEPVAVEYDGRAWVATRTYRLQVSCLDERQYHDTIVIQSPHIPEPDNPTEAQIIEYNDAVRPHMKSTDDQVIHALTMLRFKCTEFTVPDVHCSLRWKDTTKRFDDALPATFYTLQLILDVGTEVADGELGPVKKGRREWSRSGRADGSRSHYGCSGSASFTVDRMKLDGMSEEALRQVAESHVTYCDPFGIPLQLT